MNKNIIEVLNILAVIILTISLFITTSQRNGLKKQAVEKGYAEWAVDSSGKTNWKWK